jgi:hypothetical protein
MFDYIRYCFIKVNRTYSIKLFESKLTFFLFKMHDLLNGLTILFYINLTYNVE